MGAFISILDYTVREEQQPWFSG